tara:strand:+ start:15760 stop:16212 length:453 start_codon:yes stop_codon:yes gene_type:complete
MTHITGLAWWASLSAPNTTFEPCWTIDVALDAENRAKVEADGLTIKNKDDDRGDFITIKRKVEGKNGTNLAPALVDSNREPMFNTLIGNESKVNVLYRPYDWEYKGKAGRGADLTKVQVVTLVPYAVDNSEDFEVVESGYTSDDDIPFAS